MVDSNASEIQAAIILAHCESSAFHSARSKVLHKLADAELLVHALKKASSRSWGNIAVVVNAKNLQDVEKLAEKTLAGSVKIARCDDSASPLQAVEVGLSSLGITEGTVAVIPADMPLLEPEDTLLCMEAMLLDEATNAQVPYAGLLNRSATKHPPVFCADIAWLLNLFSFLRLSRAEQDSKENEAWVVALRKAIGTHYCEHPEKMLIRLCTIGYAVCPAREEDMCVISTRVDLSHAESIMQSRLVKRHQAQGVTFRDPAGTFLGVDVRIGMDTEIGVGVQINGRTRIGSGCRIEGPTNISNSTLDDGVFVRSFSCLEGAYVNDNAGVGPFARLREGTDLGPNSYIGNFVETKNTRIGQNTLACHLTYIGDAQVGSRVNIGAGTITCNFNGFAKNPTKIGDGAFVGSHSTIVAPVTIGDDSVIAAGSVITEDVPVGAVAFGRARQILKDGYSQAMKIKLQARTTPSS